MLKDALVAAAGALAMAVLATALTGPAAMAAALKCKNKANQYAACTDRLSSAPPQGKRVVPQGQVRFFVASPSQQPFSPGLSASGRQNRQLLPRKGANKPAGIRIQRTRQITIIQEM